MRTRPTRSSSSLAFTLIELLVVVAIVAILAVIAVLNFREAIERSLRAADAANLHTIATALQNYYADYNTLPPADREAGPMQSHTMDFVAVGNGPAAGGSWDGLPWLLHDTGYISDYKTMFCPKYMRLYKSGKTRRGDHARFHNFRYAYNSSALSSGGHAGGSGIMTGTKWLVRDLYLPPESGWYGSYYPGFPADYRFPWTDGIYENQVELAIYSDFAVRSVLGGTDKPPL